MYVSLHRVGINVDTKQRNKCSITRKNTIKSDKYSNDMKMQAPDKNSPKSSKFRSNVLNMKVNLPYVDKQQCNLTMVDNTHHVKDIDESDEEMQDKLNYVFRRQDEIDAGIQIFMDGNLTLIILDMRKQFQRLRER